MSLHFTPRANYLVASALSSGNFWIALAVGAGFKLGHLLFPVKIAYFFFSLSFRP
jgi:hypothetical protein